MIIISSKIRLDAMSKVISFSISDRYLDKLRSLYPALTDNLAAKQFVTDRLDGSLDDALDDNLKTLIESSLSSSLDDTLDDVLDDKLKTIIETSLDDVLDERLDAVMGKLLTSLSERMARLEERLDDSLDGRLDEMELLLRMQREASITSPLPTGEPSLFPTIEETVESAIDKVEAVTETVEAVEPISSIEPVEPAIGPVPGDTVSIESVTGEAVTIGNRQGLTNAQLSEKTRVPVSTIEKWKGKVKIGEPIVSKRYPDFFKQWRLNPTDSLWYEIN